MVKIVPGKQLIYQPAAHHFVTSQETANKNNSLGTKADLTVKMPCMGHVSSVSGISIFAQGDAMQDLKGTEAQKIETFGFILADESFR